MRREYQLDGIELRIKKAERLLQDAKREFDVKLYDSTSYYAMFHAAKAMVLSLGKDSKTHRGTIYLVWENREKLKLSEEDCSRELAEEVLRDAENFVNKAKDVIAEFKGQNKGS